MRSPFFVNLLTLRPEPVNGYNIYYQNFEGNRKTKKIKLESCDKQIGFGAFFL